MEKMCGKIVNLLKIPVKIVPSCKGNCSTVQFESVLCYSMHITVYLQEEK